MPCGVVAPVRIIPARAGFTLRRWRPWTSGRDHPRSRGVYIIVETTEDMHVGSSPLARGLLCGSLGGLLLVRIIPARAGFTPAIEAFQRFLKDHPRSRGVYGPAGASLPRAPGSSPLARGLPGVCEGKGWQPGIIPARAGFTWPGHARHGYPPDHPRSRGVYGRSHHPSQRRRGSSPLARGLP